MYAATSHKYIHSYVDKTATVLYVYYVRIRMMLTFVTNIINATPAPITLTDPSVITS